MGLLHGLLMVSALLCAGNAFSLRLQAQPPELLEYLTPNLTLICEAPSAQEMNAYRVISLVISRVKSSSSDSVMVGEVTSFGQTTSPSPSIVVEGEISDKPTESSVLQVTLLNPTPTQAGVYSCEMNLLNGVGHTAAYTVNTTVISRPVQANDVAMHLSMATTDLQAENYVLENEVRALERRVADLEQENSGLHADITSLNAALASQTAELNQLKGTVASHTATLADLLNKLNVTGSTV